MAGGSYNLVLRDPSTGNQVANIPIEAFVYLRYSIIVNDVGRVEAIINSGLYPELRDLFVYNDGTSVDYVMEVWRKAPALIFFGVAGSADVAYSAPIFKLENQYLVRYIRDEMLNDGRERFTLVGRDKNHLLKRPLIFPRTAVPATGANAAAIRAQWPWTLPIEDAFTGPHAPGSDPPVADTTDKMVALMQRAAVTNSAAFADIDVPAMGDQNNGGIPNHYINERYTNLLDALQRLSAASWYASAHGLESTPADNGVDFALVSDISSPYWPWDFETYPGGLGTDRRSGTSVPMIFSPERGNVSQPSSVMDYSDARNRIIVGGDGDDLNRDVLSLDNTTSQGHGPWNVFEFWTDSRRIDPFSAVVGEGIDQAVEHGYRYLLDKGVRKEFTFIPTDTFGAQYGVDYFIGDLVSAKFKETQEDLQVTKIEVTLGSNSKEQIAVELSPLDGSRFGGRSAFNDIEEALQTLMEALKEDSEELSRSDRSK